MEEGCADLLAVDTVPSGGRAGHPAQGGVLQHGPRRDDAQLPVAHWRHTQPGNVQIRLRAYSYKTKAEAKAKRSKYKQKDRRIKGKHQRIFRFRLSEWAFKIIVDRIGKILLACVVFRRK